ncbi:Hypothetical predicted protein, partial [Pelobates cultripes]
RAINAHIWKKKPPRISFHSLWRPFNKGGLNVPNIMLYYKATLLSQSLYVMMTSPSTLPTSRYITKSWSMWNTAIWPKAELLYLAPLSALSALSPDLQTSKWSSLGVTHVHKLLGTNGIHPFPTLQERYNLPSRDIFLYLRVKHILLSHSIEHIDPLSLSNIGSQCYHTRLIRPSCKLLSLCYRTLSDIHGHSKLTYMKQWETSLGITPTLMEWEQAITYTKKSSKCVILWEAYFKMLMRWYLVPSRIHKIYPNSPSICWRCNSSLGSIEHIFWHCPNLQNFWKDVQTTIRAICKITFPLSPEIYLLHIIPNLRDIPSRDAVLNILVAAKISIAAHWKDTKPPSLKETLGRVEVTYHHECEWAKGGNRSHVLDKWKNWESFKDSHATK